MTELLRADTASGGTATGVGRPLWAEIDLDAVAHNVCEVRRRIGERSHILAMVKANAYGHGAPPVARACLEAGASHLGVACVDEGVQLRLAGLMEAPVLVLAYSAPWEAAEIVRHRLTPAIMSAEMAGALAREARAAGIQLPVHIEVDTGMRRHGVLPPEVAGLAQTIAGMPDLRLEGLYTHFAVADEADKGFTLDQYLAFMSATEPVPGPVLRHVANSAAIADLPDMALDMVRPGICLYGHRPSDQVSRSLDLRPVLSLKSTIARLHPLRPGETVSYGRTWTAQRPTQVGLIPCGYADGLPRLVSNQGAVLVQGRRAPIIGRVCMDQFMVDVTDVPDVAVHDEAVIIGRQGDEEITAVEVAALAGTISYEVLCAVAARVPRHYLRGGQTIERSSLLD